MICQRRLNKRGTSEQWIKGRQASRENDAAELPPVPVQRGAAVAEPEGLQPAEPVAAAGDAEENRQLVVEPFLGGVAHDAQQRSYCG